MLLICNALFELSATNQVAKLAPCVQTRGLIIKFHLRKGVVPVNTLNLTHDKPLPNARKIITAGFKIIYSYLHVFGSGGSGKGAASAMGSNCWTAVSAAGAE